MVEKKNKKNNSDKHFTYNNKKNNSDKYFTYNNKKNNLDKPFTYNNKKNNSDKHFTYNNKKNNLDKSFTYNNKKNNSDKHFIYNNKKKKFYYNKKPYNIRNKKKEKPKITNYLYTRKKAKKGIFFKKPIFNDIIYPFFLNLKLIDEYFKKK